MIQIHFSKELRLKGQIKMLKNLLQGKNELLFFILLKLFIIFNNQYYLKEVNKNI
jgi:hypothetical protein